MIEVLDNIAKDVVGFRLSGKVSGVMIKIETAKWT